MENIEFLIRGGGIYSRLIRVMHYALDKKYNKFKFCSTDTNYNYFEHIFEFDDFVEYIKMDAFNTHTYFDIVNDSNYLLLKNMTSKLKVNATLAKSIDEFSSNNKIDKKTLGVHIRLTDMNTVHPEYGVLWIDSYFEKIDCLLKQKEYSNIYVSSDNKESIEKMKSRYGNLIIFNENKYIVKKEDGDMFYLQINNINNHEFWSSVFFDMLVLSKTGTLIHRLSNFSNAALIFSNSISASFSLTKYP